MGGGNARKNSFGTLTEICQSQSDCSIRGIDFPAVNSYILGVTTSRPPRKLYTTVKALRLQRAAKGFVERHDVFMGLPTGDLLLVTVLLPANMLTAS